MGAARRAATARRVAEVLEASADADPAELAHHFLAAGDRVKGLEYSVASARRALDQLAYEDAVAHYQQRADALGDADPARRCELLLALGDAHARDGDTPASKVAYREAAELAEELGAARAARPRRRSDTAGGCSGRSRATTRTSSPLLERALAAIGEEDSPLRVRLLARLGGGPLRDDHDPRRRRAITAEALDAARRLGDPSTLAYALDGYISAHHSPDFTPRQVELAGELIEVALAAGRPRARDRGATSTARPRAWSSATSPAPPPTSRRWLRSSPSCASRHRTGSSPSAARCRRCTRAGSPRPRCSSGRRCESEAMRCRGARRSATWCSWSCCAGCRDAGRGRAGRPRGGRGVRAELPAVPLRAPARPRGGWVTRTRHAPALAALAPDGFGTLNFDETWLGARRLPRRGGVRARRRASTPRRCTSASRRTPTAWPSARRRSASAPCRATSACSPPPPGGHELAADHLEAAVAVRHAHRAPGVRRAHAPRPRRADRRPRPWPRARSSLRRARDGRRRERGRRC